MPSHSRAKRIASGWVLISLVNWSYSLVTHGVKATPEINPLPLASAYALRGETERAAAELAEARRLHDGDLFSSIAQVKVTHLTLRGRSWRLRRPRCVTVSEASVYRLLKRSFLLLNSVTR
jgi:hypothetical protein